MTTLKDTPQSNQQELKAYQRGYEQGKFDASMDALNQTPQSNTDWREKLDEFTSHKTVSKYLDHAQQTRTSLIDFISQLLEAEKKRWREEVENLRKGPHNEERESVAIIHNQALDAVLQKLS